jgi:DNA-binding NarL/FixJ family response regulator
MTLGEETMTTQLDRMEWKLDQLMQLVSLENGHKREEQVLESVDFRKLTTKQHAALQMLLHGKSNAEIAIRFGVTENTAKVYVRTIAKRYGVNNRSQLVAKTLRAFEDVSESAYRILSGGLPKNWDQEYMRPDPFETLYRGE